MANGRPKKQVNLSLNGRGIAVAVIAVISGACFALGYFVGQATTKNPVEEIVISASPEDAAAEEEVTIPPEIMTDAGALPASSEEDMDAQKISSETKPPVDRKAVPPHMTEAKKSAHRTIYSVQIAAFQNRRDAEILQSKFKRKGYTTYIFRTRTKDQKTIYKVRVGKFSDRGEAERLALKLKEIEGVSPFITSL